VVVERFATEAGTPLETRVVARELRALASVPPELGEAVREILASVRARGDAAVIELTRRFDSDSAPERLRVEPVKLERALADLDGDVRTGLELAAENVRLVCEAEWYEEAIETIVDLPQGQRVNLRERPVGRAAAYVPGGRAAYPSSAIMCCVPARVAGVQELVVATPPGDDGEPSPVVLAACALCGVDEVYGMGGAQAIGALAFGTESVSPVDVIVGPGSHYVQEAKRQVVGIVGIDGVAGPSELVVVADADVDAGLVALDLAAQSEHGSDTLLALLSPARLVLDAVERELARLAGRSSTISDATVALVETTSLEAAVMVANELAPEHLELLCADAEAVAGKLSTSGCVFLGATGGTAFGDYAAGSNHVLPTGGAARFSGPLGVSRFLHRQALVSLPVRATKALAPGASSVARAEGFPVHGDSMLARARLDAEDGPG
jgi:histidinol dehydrogenase